VARNSGGGAKPPTSAHEKIAKKTSIRVKDYGSPAFDANLAMCKVNAS